MATMKSLNIPTNHMIASEPLNAKRESRNTVSADSDGQAFAQTLRQQIQQERATQSNRDHEARLNETRLSDTRLSENRNRLANQERKTQQTKLLDQTKQATLVKPNEVSAENKAIDQALAEKQVNQKVNNSAEASETRGLDDDASSLALKQALLNQKALGDENVLEKVAENISDKKADKKLLDDAQADENNIANMGWLASMMAMRENQTAQAPQGSVTETHDTQGSQASSEVLSSDSRLALFSEGSLNQQAVIGQTIASQTASAQHAQSDHQNGVTDALNALGLKTANSDKPSSELGSFSEVLAKQSNASNASPLDTGLLKQGAEQVQTLNQDQALSQERMTDIASMLNTNAANAMPSSLSPANDTMLAQINVPFGLKGWQEAMNYQVMQMTQQGSEVATLTLSPSDLGPVQVVLRVDNQSVDTAFISDNANVRQALEDGLQDLKERMASQGLQLGNTFVGNGNQAQQHFGTPEQPARASFSPATVKSTEVVSAPVRTLPLGLVDTFV